MVRSHRKICSFRYDGEDLKLYLNFAKLEFDK